MNKNSIIQNFNIGIKLWSTNTDQINNIRTLYSEGYCAYIELFAVPGTFITHAHAWQTLDIPFIIHAPHSQQGMNPALHDRALSNSRLIHETCLFADLLSAPVIVMHPGIGGDLNETVRQMRSFNDTRFAIENKPYWSLDGRSVCNGYSVGDISLIMKETGVRFCLDFGHAISAANAQKIDYREVLQQFIALQPVIYHITDGDIDGVIDNHLNFGKGTYPLKELFALLPESAMVTNEANKDFSRGLEDYRSDLVQLRSMLTGEL